jgi:UPF0755 protein
LFRRFGLFLIPAIAAGAYVAFLFAFAADLLRPLPLGSGLPVPLVVEEGMSLREVGEEALRVGAIRSVSPFVEEIRKLGLERSLRPGLYRLRPGSAYETARQIARQEPEARRFTLVPGRDLTGPESPPGLRSALARGTNYPEALRPLLPAEAEGRLPFLLPETYRVASGKDEADRLVRAASRAWLGRFRADIEGLPPERLRRASILASVVEKEAKVSSDRPVIAGVFENRLSRGMPLQSCATVIYAWKLRGIRLSSLLIRHLMIDSPYNTYLNRGLPPEPIGLPSEGSWRASLSPDPTDYLYFVADRRGTHVFSRTYRDHLRAKKLIEAGTPLTPGP